MTDDDLIIELICTWEEARAEGKSPSVEELCRDCPHLVEAVRGAIDRIQFADGLLDRAVPPVADATDSLPQVPGYEVLNVLGKGGMGVVYRARQINVNRVVALKMIRSGELSLAEERARFQIEAEAIASLRHPNIVQLHEFGTHQGLPYFTLEYIDGGSLAARIKDDRLPAEEAASLVATLARAVATAHAHGIVHRDLKPENVLLLADGTPKIADFGLAKHIETAATFVANRTQVDSDRQADMPKRSDSDLTRTGAIMGTPSYMAPEQARGDKVVGPPADIWSLGAILYRVLTGRPPFLGATSFDTVKQVIEAEPVPPRNFVPRLSRDLETICLKCLRKEPEKRYATAAGLADDLRRWLNNEPIQAKPVGSLERAWKWVNRNPVVCALIVTIILLGAIGTAGIYLKYRQAKEQEAEAIRLARIALANEQRAISQEVEAIKQADIARVNANTANSALVEKEKAIGDLGYERALDKILLAKLAFDSRNALLAWERLDQVPMPLRRWEWHYLSRQFVGGFIPIGPHNGWVSSVSFSPDDARIASAATDGKVRVWDARTGARLLEFGAHGFGVSSVSFSPDGSRLLTSGFDGTANVWNARTGKPLLQLRGHLAAVMSAAFSPDGTQILTGSADKTARLWDAQSGTMLRALTGHNDHINSVAFSPGGSWAVTGSGDATARIWDLQSGIVVKELTGHGSAVTCVAASPDGSRIATASRDKLVKVWNARTGELLVDLTGHANSVDSVAFSPDATRIVTASQDQTARVWDAKTGASALEIKGHTWTVASAAFSRDGNRIATASLDKTVVIWDAMTGGSSLEIGGHTNAILSAVFSPEGTRIITGSADKIARVFQSWTGALYLELKGHDAAVSSVTCSADGSRIATGSADGTARIWCARSGTLLRELKGHSREVTCVAFNSDGDRVVTGSADGLAKVWDADSGAPLFDLKKHRLSVATVAFSPDGLRIVTGSADFSTRIWNAKTGAHIRELKGHIHRVNSATFSPDGTSVVTGSWDRTARVWNADAGMLLFELKGHSQFVQSVAYSPDGARIVSGSLDGTIRIWDAKTGAPLLELAGHPAGVNAVAFSSDGERIISAGNDRRVRVWDGRKLQDATVEMTSAEWNHRMCGTRPRPEIHREQWRMAAASANTFAARFHLDRLLAYAPSERVVLLAERLRTQPGDLLVHARTAIHSPALAQPSPGEIFVLSTRFDPLSMRLLGGLLIRGGQPESALAPVTLALSLRRANRPPVEELLLALACLNSNRTSEAIKWHARAVEWLDRPQLPLMSAMGGSYAGADKVRHSLVDPRFDPFDWETWHECEALRAEVEASLQNKRPSTKRGP